MFSSFSFHLTDSFLKLLRSAPFLHPLQREVLYNSNMGLSHSTFHWKILDLLNDFFKFVYIKVNSLSYKVLQLLTNASLSCIHHFSSMGNSFYCPKESSMLHLFSNLLLNPNPWQPLILFFVSIVLPLPECCLIAIIHYIAFSDRLL